VSYYPVLLDLAGRDVAVVGGGAVAREKALGLLEAEARVVVFAAELEPELAALERAGRIVHRRGEPGPEDLATVALVVAERRGADHNAALHEAATRAGRFVNVQDEVASSSFIAPAIVRQGDLVVAISTSGAAPVLAVRLRQHLERGLGPEYARFLTLARRFRAPLAAAVPCFDTRRERWYRLVDSPVWDCLRGGDEEGARRLAVEILGVHPDG